MDGATNRKGTALPRTKYATDVERIKRNVVVDENGCWIWQLHLSPGGYGYVKIGPRSARVQVMSHRLSYMAFVGEIPEGLQLDHLCRVRACCNPAHLEPVTCRENLLRGETYAAANVAKSECPQGHPYVAENLRKNKPGRNCRECHREYMRDYNARPEVRAAKRARRARRAAGIEAA